MTIDKVYYSVLVKAAVTKSYDPGQSPHQVLQNVLLIHYTLVKFVVSYVDSFSLCLVLTISP